MAALEQKRQEMFAEAKFLNEMRANLEARTQEYENRISSDRKRASEKFRKAAIVNPVTLFGSGSKTPKAAALATENCGDFYFDRQGRRVFKTPLKNIAITAALLDDSSPASIEQAKILVRKALEQRDVVRESKKLASQSNACSSVTNLAGRANAAEANQQPAPPNTDNQSVTRSTQRRRRDARNRKDAIPISDDNDANNGRNHDGLNHAQRRAARFRDRRC